MAEPENNESKILQAVLNQLGITEESAHKFKFGGIVGKVALIALVGLICSVGIAKYTTGLIQLVLVLGAFATTLGIVGLVLRFGAKHPISATLEGTEVILWQQQVIATKFGEVPKGQTLPNPGGSPPQLPPQAGAEE